MRKNLTEIVFILDRSGSMSGLEADTIGGFNSLIEKQKLEEGEALVSTVLFDDVTQVLHDRQNLQTIQPLTRKEYYVRGCTALLDAVGGAIHHIGNVHKYAREEDRPEKTLFIITTDHGGYDRGHGTDTDGEKWIFVAIKGKTVNHTTLQYMQVKDFPAIVLHALGVPAHPNWMSHLPEGLFSE